MSTSRSVELVPDTPTGTAEQHHDGGDSTLGDSYLFEFIRPQTSPTSTRIPDNERHTRANDTTSTASAASNRLRLPLENSIDQQQGSGEIGVESVADSQVRHTRRKTEEMNETRRSRLSDEGNLSRSQPVEGPGGSGECDAGDLEEQTQFGAYSLDKSWDKSSRRQRRSNDGSVIVAGNGSKTGDLDGEVSMDLTRTAGGLEDEEVDELASSLSLSPKASAEEGDSTGNLRESQKENGSSSRPSTNPASSAPLALRNSHANLEPSASGPSSSPAVAQQLLQRRRPLDVPPKASLLVPSHQNSTLSSTSSSKAVQEQLVRGKPTLPSSSPEKDLSGIDFPGPETSTPAFAIVAPPMPALTQARSVPTFNFLTRPTEDPDLPPLRSAKTSLAPNLPVDPGLFATSAAMKPPPPRRRKTKEAWDGISQDTPEESPAVRGGTLDQEEAEIAMSPTQVHEEEDEDEEEAEEEEEEEEEEEKDRDLTPKPTAERTIDMDLDEDDSSRLSIDYHGGTLDQSTVQGDDSYPEPSPPRPVQPTVIAHDSSSVESSSNVVDTQQDASRPLFVEQSTSSSSSPNTSQERRRLDSSGQQPDDSKNKRLSDISDVRSSQELPPTQYEVEATQKVYDAERSQLSMKSIDMDITNSSTWHGPFAHGESGSTSRSRQRSIPQPGRELKRVPPPPTPNFDPSSEQAIPFRLDESTPVTRDSSPRLQPTADPSSSHSTRIAREPSMSLPDPSARFTSVSDPPLPTQRIAESSPDVPLSRISARPRQLSPPNLASRRRSTLSPDDYRQNSSSHGVVPDSEGPTQPEPIALTSKINQDVVDEQGEEEESLGSMSTLDDLVAKSKSKKRRVLESEEERSEAEKEEVTPKKQAKETGKKGKGKASKKSKKDVEEEEEPVKEKKAKKGKKANSAVVDGTSKVDRKGKGRAVQEESDDDFTPVDEDRIDETNYSTLPRADNAKRPSPEKKKEKKKKVSTTAVVVVPARSSRRKASGPSIIEQSDEEDGGDEPVSSTKRKRTSSVAPVAAVTSPKRTKRTASSKTASTTTATKKKKVTRRTSTSIEPDASVIPEPNAPVAGPSRLRFDVPDDTASPAVTSRTSSVAGGKSRSRLPPSAPFSRCFGLWRDNGYFYGGEILSIAAGHFNVKFDDGTKAKIRPDEVRRCRLNRGDKVQYCGSEAETETQVEVLSRDLRVIKVVRGPKDEEANDQLEKQDVVIVESEEADGQDRIQRLLVEAIRIPPSHSVKLDDRKLTLEELAAFEGRTRSDVKALPILDTPTRPDVVAFEENEKKSGLFARMAFVLTYSSPSVPGERISDAERDRFTDRLKANGATIIDWNHLFEVSGVDDNGRPDVFFPSIDFENIDTILLLADRPTTTVKYLIALALGIPCCSKEFAVESMKAGTRLAWNDFIITAGFVQSLNTYGIGGQLRALLKSTYDLASLATAQRGKGLFAGQSFLVIVGKKGKEKTEFNRHLYILLSILAACSASRVHFLSLPLPASSPFSNPSELVASASTYTHVFLDIDESETAVEKAAKPLIMQHKGIVNMDWVKQCLMAGRLLPSERMKKSKE